MPESVNPPPNERFSEGETAGDGDHGWWYEWPVVNGNLAAPVLDVEETVIEPEDNNVNGHMAVNEEYDHPVDGIQLTVELPDVKRWNNLSDAEHETLADPTFTLLDCTTRDEWLFTDPRDVSHGWDSPWHALAGIKRKHLHPDLSIHALVGRRLLFSGHPNDDGSVEWVLDVDNPLGGAIWAAENR